MEDRLISEADLMKSLGLKKADCARARNDMKLPFVKVTSRCRCYFLSDIMEWAKKHRLILDKDAGD